MEHLTPHNRYHIYGVQPHFQRPKHMPEETEVILKCCQVQRNYVRTSLRQSNFEYPLVWRLATVIRTHQWHLHSNSNDFIFVSRSIRLIWHFGSRNPVNHIPEFRYRNPVCHVLEFNHDHTWQCKWTLLLVRYDHAAARLVRDCVRVLQLIVLVLKVGFALSNTAGRVASRVCGLHSLL